MTPIEAKRDWWEAVRQWARVPPATNLPRPVLSPTPAKIGLALGGGFARGIAHVGVLRVFEKHQIPIHCIGGVSAGAIAAAAFASGSTSEEIGRVGSAMRFADVARWCISRMGLAASERMDAFLRHLLKVYHFEQMRIPLGVVATDLNTGNPVYFKDRGEVMLPIRASCSYPGLFQPIRHDGMLLVDGAMSIEIPAGLMRSMGATRVVSVHLPMQGAKLAPNNMLQVVNRCFQIMQVHMEAEWRRQTDIVITPDVVGMEWDSFRSAEKMIEAGENAALAVLPKIQSWLRQPEPSPGIKRRVQGLKAA